MALSCPRTKFMTPMLPLPLWTSLGCAATECPPAACAGIAAVLTECSCRATTCPIWLPERLPQYTVASREVPCLCGYR
jgi:hypothetical protein